MKSVRINFRFDSSSGWISTNPESMVTKRGKAFFPVLVQLVKLFPVINGPVGMIQQVRLFGPDDQGKQWLGTLLCVQQLPSETIKDGFSNAKLLVPAIYVEEEWTEERKSTEESWIAGYIGGGKKDTIKRVKESIEKHHWNYDAIFQFVEVKAHRNSNTSGILSIEFKLVSPEKKDIGACLDLRPFWGCDVDENPNSVLNSTFCLPWYPPDARLVKEDECVVYLVSSEAARRTLIQVNNLWQSNLTRNIVLASPPGGGKDVIARLIHHGRAKGSYRAISTCGEKWEDLRVPLLGLAAPAGPTIFKGLIEEAIRGSILFDEIDKAQEATRQSLLRIIEADEYYRPGGGDKVVIGKDDRPLFIFAGSGGGKTGNVSVRERMESISPADFWQRIDTWIEMHHPLEDEGWAGKVQLRILVIVKPFVALFMQQAREKLLTKASNRHSPFSAERLLLLSTESIRGQIRDRWGEAVQALTNVVVGRKIGGGKPPSIRSIRALAQEWVIHVYERARDNLIPADLLQECQERFQ